MTFNPETDRIVCSSGVNREGKPFVHYTWEGEIRKCQWSPAEARQHALILLACADAAESDACVFRLLKESVGIPEATAAVFLRDLRNFRREPIE